MRNTFIGTCIIQLKLCRFGYAVQNEFKLHNSIMKLDFDDPSQTKFYELEDGEFGTEPVFVENPEGNGEVEDDGWVVVQTLNGRKIKATIVILNATTMEVEFKATKIPILDRSFVKCKPFKGW